ENEDARHARVRADYEAGLVGHAEAVSLLGYDPDADDYKATPAPFALPALSASKAADEVEDEVDSEESTRLLRLKAAEREEMAASWGRMIGRLVTGFEADVARYLTRQH